MQPLLYILLTRILICDDSLEILIGSKYSLVMLKPFLLNFMDILQCYQLY
ncbi:MAG: hypothetical protein TECD_00017 [Hyphomicrobiaceae bacterium hypho_1]